LLHSAPCTLNSELCFTAASLAAFMQR